MHDGSGGHVASDNELIKEVEGCRNSIMGLIGRALYLSFTIPTSLLYLDILSIIPLRLCRLDRLNAGLNVSHTRSGFHLGKIS